ncbi:hypothetical protein B0H14DRAFT_1306625 [Mycena olivaceomarginata]|nr:hypothetical protein B0H14DRAFT_1306625 [Mycena olivaceomarginata]
MTHLLRYRGLQQLLTAAPATFRVSNYFCSPFLDSRSKKSRPGRFFSSATRLRRDAFEDQLAYGSFPRTDAKLLNQQLVDSVNQENFAGAERLRLHLESECAPIEPNPVYERAALAQIHRHNKQDLQGFLMWLRLVPDNKHPSRVENGPLTKTRNTLFRTGNPARNLLLITEFSLVCAAKGYGKLVWGDLVALMTRFQHADKAVAFFRSFETALLDYYAKYHPVFVEETASRQRYLLIMLCCEAGWLDEAVQIVQDSSAYRILTACEQLIHFLRARNDLASIALVETFRHNQRQAEALPLQPLSEIPPTPALPPPKPSISKRINDLFDRPSGPPKVDLPPSPTHFYSIRAIIKGTSPPRSRTWIAMQLRELKRAIVQRSLTHYNPPGRTLHQLMAHHNAHPGRPRGLLTLRKRALAASDPSSYIWLCKEMYYLHESRKFADILAVFDANFDAAFLPAVPWRVLRDAATPAEPRRASHAVPKKMKISGADAWLIWNALVQLSVSVVADPHALPLLQELHYSAVHFSAQLTGRQFRAFPTSYTAVFRSIVWAYGELGEIDKAVAAAGRHGHDREARRGERRGV